MRGKRMRQIALQTPFHGRGLSTVHANMHLVATSSRRDDSGFF
jgi:hypothetical protein